MFPVISTPDLQEGDIMYAWTSKVPSIIASMSKMQGIWAIVLSILEARKDQDTPHY